MSARRYLSHPLTELRKWDLTPVGAAFVVALIGIAVFGFWLTTGGAQSQEDQIRAYLASSEGGSAPRDETKLIDVRECNRVGEAGESYVVRCTLEHRSETFTSCFDFQGDRLVPDRREARESPGCETPVVWSPETDSLIAR